MSHDTDTDQEMFDPDAFAREIADDFGIERDKLAKHEPILEPKDPDGLKFWRTYTERKRASGAIGTRTVRSYTDSWNLWTEHMASEGRHPVLPSVEHVRSWIVQLETEGVVTHSVHRHVNIIESAYEWWLSNGMIPAEGDDSGDGLIYNPFSRAKAETDLVDRAKQSRNKARGKNYPAVSMDELRETIGNITHIRDKAVVVLNLKLGVRRGGLSNIQLKDLHIDFGQVLEYYGGQIATNPLLEDNENAVVIPSNREGTKSKEDRIIPLDPEAQRLILEYLLVRPDAPDPEDPDNPDRTNPYLFLSSGRHGQLRPERITEIWERHFGHLDTDGKDPIRSHYGRNRFVTHFEDVPEMSPRMVKYLRGDKLRNDQLDDGDAYNSYLNAWYSEVEPIYREHIYPLAPGVSNNLFTESERQRSPVDS